MTRVLGAETGTSKASTTAPSHKGAVEAVAGFYPLNPPGTAGLLLTTLPPHAPSGVWKVEE